MTDLNALVGSRICHDLVNPLGAIGNGLELLTLGHAGLADSAEMGLIADSVARATAKVRLMRLAFGAASPGAEIGGEEITQILAGLYGSARLQITAALPPALPRWTAKAILLSVLCAECALPRGGDLNLRSGRKGTDLAAQGPRLALTPDLWHPLAQGLPPATDLTPANVQFALLAQTVADAGHHLRVTWDETGVSLSF